MRRVHPVTLSRSFPEMRQMSPTKVDATARRPM
jgi:hypothetical protein